MKPCNITIDLHELVRADVYPSNTIVTNRRFKGFLPVGPDNPPFFRLARLAKYGDKEILATPADLNFNAYHDRATNIRASGQLGRVIGHVNPQTEQVRSVDYDEGVTFIGAGRRLYTQVQGAIDQTLVDAPVGSNKAPSA